MLSASHTHVTNSSELLADPGTIERIKAVTPEQRSLSKQYLTTVFLAGQESPLTHSYNVGAIKIEDKVHAAFFMSGKSGGHAILADLTEEDCFFTFVSPNNQQCTIGRIERKNLTEMSQRFNVLLEDSNFDEFMNSLHSRYSIMSIQALYDRFKISENFSFQETRLLLHYAADHLPGLLSNLNESSPETFKKFAISAMADSFRQTSVLNPQTKLLYFKRLLKIHLETSRRTIERFKAHYSVSTDREALGLTALALFEFMGGLSPDSTSEELLKPAI